MNIGNNPNIAMHILVIIVIITYRLTEGIPWQEFTRLERWGCLRLAGLALHARVQGRPAGDISGPTYLTIIISRRLFYKTVSMDIAWQL